MPGSQPRYRKAYFAMVRKLDLDADERHDLNEAVTGRRSTREFGEQDWRDVLARLQQLTGRKDVEAGKPHLRGQRPRRHDKPHPLDGAASDEQIAYLLDLRDRIIWRHPDGPDEGLVHCIYSVVFARVQPIQADLWLRSWGSGARNVELQLRTLPRKVASLALVVLKRMAAAGQVERRIVGSQ